MKYQVWDNDNGIIVCCTDSRKEAFGAVLNHLIKAADSEVTDPIMWPVKSVENPNEQMPGTTAHYNDCWAVIRWAQMAYNRIADLI